MIDGLEEEVDMLSRHLQVLKTVITNEPIGIVKISNELDYPHHKVRYSLRVLEEADLVEPTAQGAVTTDDVEDFIATLDNELDSCIEKLRSMKMDGVEISQ